MLQPPPEESRKRPITLGCVIVAVLVALLFAALLVPALMRARMGAMRAQCLSNLKQLGLAMHMYSQDNDEGFPSVGGPRGKGGVASLGLLYAKYVTDPNIFVCASDEDVTPWNGKGTLDAAHCSYGYDHNHTSTDPADVALVSDYTGFEDSPYGLPMCHYHPFVAMRGPPPGNGMNVLFIDGHVKWAGKNRECGRNGDDIFTKSETLPPGEDSWITQ